MTEQVTLQVLTLHGHTVVAVSGDIDVSTASALREAIDGLIQNGTRQLIVDLDDVGFMDSSGLSTLTGALRQLGPGSIRVVASQQHIRRVFSITGIDQVIPVFDSMDIAIEAAPRPIVPD